MIPILYEKTETAFTSNGLGRLSDCISCICTEERNGLYEVEFQYGVSGVHFEDIQIGRIISVTHDEQGDRQPFDIYRKSEPINGVVTFNARHISYRLSEITVEPFEASSCAQAIAGLKTNSIGTNPFTFNTDKSTSGTYKVSVPSSCRALLGGTENSLLDVFGAGEYKFDKFNVDLKIKRGQDTNISIRYGKNLVDFENDVDYGATYNAVAPYWFGQVYDDSTGISSDVLVTLTEKYISSGQTLPNGRLVIVPMDLSDQFDSPPTETQLRTLATSKLTNDYSWVPSQNIRIDFVQLWQTEEYKRYAPLQRVRLCDTVLVDVPMYNISNLRIKVIRVVYNVLLDRYDEMELGTPQVTLAGAISQSTDVSDLVRNSLEQYSHQENSALYNAIQTATDLITGGLGGYVTIVRNANGKPIELVIADSEDLSEAINVWRWNQNGIGYSSNGYNGTFTTAWTIDGHFLADFINAGTLSDGTGKNYWNLASGFFQTKQGRIGSFDVTNTALKLYTDTSRFDLNDSLILFRENDDGGRRQGAKITPVGIDWTYRNDQTAWGMFIAGYINFVYNGSYSGWAMKFGFYNDDVIYIYQNATDGIPNIDVQYPIIFWDDITVWSGNVDIQDNLDVFGNFWVGGQKQRRVKTENYSYRFQNCYETPTPIFADIGEAVIDEDGLCYVDIDDIFLETIAEKVEYQVFLQKEGSGDCWVADKQQRYFVIRGTPNLKVAWEIKAKQKDYENIRLETKYDLDEYERIKEDADFSLKDYINEQEELLYG